MTNRQKYHLNNLDKIRYHVHEEDGLIYTRVLYKGRKVTEIYMNQYKGLVGEDLKRACSRYLYKWLDSECTDGK